MTLYTFKYIALHICLQHTFYINTMYKYNINALDSNTFYDLTYTCIKNKKGQFFTNYENESYPQNFIFIYLNLQTSTRFISSYISFVNVFAL